MRSIFIAPLKLSETEKQLQNAVFRSVVIMIPMMGKVHTNGCRRWCFSRANVRRPGCQLSSLINVYLPSGGYSLTLSPKRNPLLQKRISCLHVLSNRRNTRCARCNPDSIVHSSLPAPISRPRGCASMKADDQIRSCSTQVRKNSSRRREKKDQKLAMKQVGAHLLMQNVHRG